jgi:predicted  nucleic acid-binding Zn-ribbon protein
MEAEAAEKQAQLGRDLDAALQRANTAEAHVSELEAGASSASAAEGALADARARVTALEADLAAERDAAEATRAAAEAQVIVVHPIPLHSFRSISAVYIAR